MKLGVLESIATQFMWPWLLPALAKVSVFYFVKRIFWLQESSRILLLFNSNLVSSSPAYIIIWYFLELYVRKLDFFKP